MESVVEMHQAEKGQLAAARSTAVVDCIEILVLELVLLGD